jgi:hypothetical protein
MAESASKTKVVVAMENIVATNLAKAVEAKQ